MLERSLFKFASSSLALDFLLRKAIKKRETGREREGEREAGRRRERESKQYHLIP